MQWYSPWALLLLLSLPFLGYFLLRRKRSAAVKFPSLVDMRRCPVSWRLRLRPVLVVARLLCLALLILALARPRKGTTIAQVSTEGVAIEAVVDRSPSMGSEMTYEGKTMNRLEVVKQVLASFIEGDQKGLTGRPGDLIGMVAFARYADTVCPLVLSHNVLTEFLKKTETAIPGSPEDSTAIGDALALAAARLKKAEEEIRNRNAKLGFGDVSQSSTGSADSFQIKSKIIILLTDGLNMTGERSPLEAAELARKWGIKIYTIGIGSDQSFAREGLFGLLMMRGDELDERLLKAIADKTGGFYSRADDGAALRDIVKRINELEKTEVKSVQYTQYAEHFNLWTLPALALLGFEMLAGCTIFRKIP